jgi:hypothetical protein
MTTNTESANTPTRYAIIECGKDKHDGPLPAKDLYKSTYFELKRDWAEEFTDHYWILSAEFGLIPASQEIPEYDTTVDDVDTAEWLSMVFEQIQDSGDLLDHDAELWVLVSQGKQTANAPNLTHPTLREFLEDAKFDVKWPFDETAGIGYQMGWLRTSIDGGQVGMPSTFN